MRYSFVDLIEFLALQGEFLVVGWVKEENTDGAFKLVFEFLYFDKFLVEIVAESVFVSSQILNFEFLVAHVHFDRIDLVFDQTDFFQCGFVMFGERVVIIFLS